MFFKLIKIEFNKMFQLLLSVIKQIPLWTFCIFKFFFRAHVLLITSGGFLVSYTLYIEWRLYKSTEHKLYYGGKLYHDESLNWFEKIDCLIDSMYKATGVDYVPFLILIMLYIFFVMPIILWYFSRSFKWFRLKLFTVVICFQLTFSSVNNNRVGTHFVKKKYETLVNITEKTPDVFLEYIRDFPIYLLSRIPIILLIVAVVIHTILSIYEYHKRSQKLIDDLMSVLPDRDKDKLLAADAKRRKSLGVYTKYWFIRR